MLSTPQLISPIEVLLHTLSAQYLSYSYCLSIASEFPFNFNLLTSFIYINPNEMDVTSLSDKLLQALDIGCSDYIIRVENPLLFMRAFERTNRLGIVRRSDKKLIFLPPPGGNFTYRALEVLSTSECSSVANVLMILPNNEENCETFNLITHKFVGPDSEIDQPLFLDRWNSCTQRFKRNANLFPHDMANMMGKTLRASGFTYKPYVILDLNTTEISSGRDGIDIRTLDELCRWINCSIAIIKEDKDLWGKIYKNQTGIGIIGSVVENRADMGITGLYSWYEGWLDMDFSITYIIVAVTCLVPAPRIIESWEIPLLPFTSSMWLAVFITFCCGSVGLCLAQRGSTDKVLLTVFGIMITQPQHNAGYTWRIRSIIGWLLATALIVISAYAAGLAVTFTVPKYEASIDTVQDIFSNDMKWGAAHDAWTYSLKLSSEHKVQQLVKQFRVYSFEELKRRSFTRSMAFSIERLPAGTYAIADYITKEAVLDMQILQEDFYYEQCVIMMRKNSEYSKKINQLVGRLHQSGLFLAWEQQVTLKYMDFQVQLTVKWSRTRSDTKYKSFSIKQVQGVFMIYLLGVTTAIILFIGEMIFMYYKNHETMNNVFW